MSELLKVLAERVGGTVLGDPSTVVTGVADIESAVEGDIVFAESSKLFADACHSKASAILARSGNESTSKAQIIVENPRLAYAQVLELFSPLGHRHVGVHHTSVIGEGSILGDNPSIGCNVSIGRNVSIGHNVWIYPFVFIGDNARIGDDCIIHPFVSIYDNVTMGDRVILHSSVVIGADGFGYISVDGKHYKIPQIGTVAIGDDVEIGANSCVDRARTGTTTVGSGTKIDNLVQVGHNVTIGTDCILASQAGVSGSVNMGDRVILTGQAGVKDHVTIGNDSVLAGRAAVMSDVEPGAFLSGYPARPHKENMKTLAAQARLPNMIKQIKELERRIAELEERQK